MDNTESKVNSYCNWLIIENTPVPVCKRSHPHNVSREQRSSAKALHEQNNTQTESSGIKHKSHFLTNTSTKFTLMVCTIKSKVNNAPRGIP